MPPEKPPTLVATEPLKIHPSTAHLVQFFDFDHLPERLASVSRPFCELASKVLLLPDNPEKTECLRKLLEAKDCAVRSIVAK